MATKRTRTYTNHPIFGQPSDLPANVLPTNGDVLRYVWKVKCDMEETAVGKRFKAADKNTTIKQAISIVTEKWEMAVADRTKMPLKRTKAMESQLKRMYDKGFNLNANTKNKEHTKVTQFREEMKTLFDVCLCQCSQVSCETVYCKITSCEEVHLSCSCEVKVPKRELKFLFDQRGDRKMYIGGVDENVTSMWDRAAERERREDDRLAKKQRDEEICEKEREEAQKLFLSMMRRLGQLLLKKWIQLMSHLLTER